MKRHHLISLLVCPIISLMAASPLEAQQYTGLTGLLHTPSAEMNSAGTARVGAHFLNKNSTPDQGFIYDGAKYHTFDYYMSITPFSWFELGFTCTERKTKGTGDIGGYNGKDRYFSLKVRPLEEGKYWPSVAFGANDFYTEFPSESEETGVQYYFGNFYISLTKHFEFGGNRLGTTLSYRRFYRTYNSKWNGLVGGVTFSPAFAPQLRAVAEYDGCGVNIGADVLLWKFLLLQVSLQDFKYPNGGICLQIDLL